MQGGTIDHTKRPQVLLDDYERVSRRGRWFGLITLVLIYPLNLPSTPYVHALLAVYALCNLSRHIPYFLRRPVFASPLTMLVIDNIFVALMIALVSNLNSPFAWYAIFPIISAAYRYQLKGTLLVVALQLGWSMLIIRLMPFPPVYLDNYRALLVAAMVFIGLGLFVQGLTTADRTERNELKSLGRELENGRSQLLTLLNSLTDAIFVVDDRGRIQDHNAAAPGLCSGRGDLHGRSFLSALELHPHINPAGKPVNLLKQSGPQHRRDLCVQLGSNAVIDLDITVQPVQVEGRRAPNYIVVCKDITKERSLDEQRTEFIAVASHELRTPITIMEAALSAALLSRDKMDEQTVTVIEQAHTHCLFLAGIVKDLAILAEASNDNLPVQFERIDAGHLLRQMADDFTAQAKQKNIRLTVVVAENTPMVLSTQNHIREILQNYITNAIKYTPAGTVTLRAEASKRGGVLFGVHDKGIGISPTDQKRLFTKFFRSEDYRTRQTGGTGLGLYLCMELAQRLNGKVWCESELNKGSVFFLEVPPVSNLSRDQTEVVKAEVANIVEGI